MRLFFLEHDLDYERYAFAYRPMLELEAGDSLSAVFSQGFLPYSGQVEESRDLFYLARSLRYDLKDFSLDKKRRYAMRQVDALQPDFCVQPKEQALAQLQAPWRKQVSQWMQERHGAPYLSDERIHYVLSKPYCSHLIRVQIAGEPFAYILLGVSQEHAHYWYAFYDSTRIPEYSPGKWLMARTAQWAQEAGLRYLYVGTAYAPKSAYKAHGVNGAEFFEGSGWSRNLEELRRRQEADLNRSGLHPPPSVPTLPPHCDR